MHPAVHRLIVRGSFANYEAAQAAQHATEWQDFYSSYHSDRNSCFGDLSPRFHALGAEYVPLPLTWRRCRA
jgi:hypothetical protein